MKALFRVREKVKCFAGDELRKKPILLQKKSQNTVYDFKKMIDKKIMVDQQSKGLNRDI